MIGTITNRPLFSVSGTIPAPLETVAALLFSIHEGALGPEDIAKVFGMQPSREPLRVSGGPRHYDVYMATLKKRLSAEAT